MSINMSYCRFQNTLEALKECRDALYDAGPDPFAELSKEEARAARWLIAAAPELLEALRDLVQFEADGRTEYESAIEYWERARAAIYKALGEQA